VSDGSTNGEGTASGAENVGDDDAPRGGRGAAAVAVDGAHPLRAELERAARGAARSGPSADADVRSHGPSISVSVGSARERVGPDTAVADAAAADAVVDEAPGVVTVVVGEAANGGAFASLDAALDAALVQLETAAARWDDAADGLMDEAVEGGVAVADDWLVRIELRFDGPLACDALRIERANVDIVAGEGYSPVLTFRPPPSAASDESYRAITVVEGELTVERVAMELQSRVGLGSSDRLFVAQEADLIRLRDCALTITSNATSAATATGEENSPAQAKAAFFDVEASRAATAARVTPEMPEMNGAMPLLTVRLDRCVARGDADFMRVGGARNARLTWSNGLAVLGGSLLAVEGSRQALPGAHVRAMLSHVTVGLRGNLAAMANSQTTPFLPVVEVESYDGIYVGMDQPLVASLGIDGVEDFRARFRWKGERNFYDNWTRLWRIAGGGVDSEAEEMGFRDWVSHWGRAESAPSLGPVIWRNPISLARPLDDQQLADFALADTDANPARGSAEKGVNAGATFDRLPAFPWRGRFVRDGTP
jgi:hypothetical protein